MIKHETRTLGTILVTTQSNIFRKSGFQYTREALRGLANARPRRTRQLASLAASLLHSKLLSTL